MNTRERIALSWPPMLLRAALGVTFLWAGAGKVFHYEPVTRAEAVALGLTESAAQKAPAETDRAPSQANPPAASPSAPSVPAVQMPPGDRPTKPSEKPESGKPESGKSTSAKPASKPPARKEPAKPTVSKTGGLAVRDDGPGTADTGNGDGTLRPDLLNPEPPVAAAPATKPGPVPAPAGDVRGLYKLALAINTAGTPSTREDGKPGMALVPATLAGGAWPVRLAWGVAAIELVGGAMILFGLLTRLWAILIAGVMVGALWLVDIGPAMASGNAVLGFLPAHPVFSVPDWQGPLWRFGLLCSAAALFFAGPGLAALDGALFGGKPAGAKPPPGDARPKPG
ncbi:MAG: DoxX family protein [Phycisphaerales bacterium]